MGPVVGGGGASRLRAAGAGRPVPAALLAALLGSLLAAGCSSGGTAEPGPAAGSPAAASSSGSRPGPPTVTGATPSTSSASAPGEPPASPTRASSAGPDPTAGLGESVPVPATSGVDLAGATVHHLAVDPRGGAWVVATRPVQGPGAGVGTGVWHGRIGRPGTWYRFGSVEDLALAPDGRPWLVVGTALVTRADGGWRRVLGPTGVAWLGVHAVAVGPDGTVWAVGPGDGLTRYDGSVWTVPAADQACLNDVLAVGADGAVWSSGLSGWFPTLGCLRHMTATTTWVHERPLAGRDVPARLLAADPAGPVWAWLMDYQADPRLRLAGQALVRFDGALTTSITRDPWPAGSSDAPWSARSMAAGGGLVWVVLAPEDGDPCRRSDGSPAATQGGRLFGFDGATWTRVRLSGRPGAPVTAVLAADRDGAAWVTTCQGALRRVRPPSAG